MIWLFALAVLAFYFAVLYKSQSFTEKIYESGKTPVVLLVLLKIFVRIVSRRQGQIYHANDRSSETRDGEERKTSRDSATEGQHISPSDDEIVVINNYRSFSSAC